MYRFCLGTLVVLVTFTAPLGDIAGAEPVPMDWSQYKIEPEPANAPTLREKMLAHLARVDRCLGELRAACRHPNQILPADRLSPTECFTRLDGAWVFVGTPSHLSELVSDMGSTDELLASLARAKDIAQKAQDGDELTPEMSNVLQAAHGLVKAVRRHFTKIPATPEVELLSNTAARPKAKCGRPALIVRPTAALAPTKMDIDYPIGFILWQLATLTPDQRTRFMKSIVEDDNTRLNEILAERDPITNASSLLVLVSKDIELPDGGIRTVQLPFRTTFERRGTEGLGQLLRILSNTSTEAEVIVRTTLLGEIPVTNDLSITACESVMTFRPVVEGKNRGQTVVSFTGEIELAFYGRLSSRLRDVSFRSIAVSKSNTSIERANERSLIRTCDELKQLLESATNQSTGSKSLLK